jgi:hypothetical protein
MIHFPFVSRPITTRPWNRFPSDTWHYADAKLSPLASLVCIGFSFLFTLAWNFHFPTYAEQLLWRICSVYHTAFTIYGGAYYLIETFGSGKRQKLRNLRQVTAPPPVRAQDAEAQSNITLHPRSKNKLHRRGKLAMDWIKTWRNISPEQDPNMEVPLRILLPVTVICFLYILCRMFIYFEDFFSLRIQPAGVYMTVNKFMPFLVGK